MRRSTVVRLSMVALLIPVGHLAGVGGVMIAPDRLLPAVAAAPPSPAIVADPPLRTVAAARNLRIGSAVSDTALLSSNAYRDRLRYEFNSVTPENSMKWSWVEARRGQYNWAPVDAVVDFAVANNQTVRGHTLVWHQSIPGWITEGSFTDAELRAILKQHIGVMMRRYAGRVGVWDVANEVLDPDGTLRSSFWLDRLGEGYLADIFRWARAADPRAKLYINDYEIEYDTPKRAALYALVRDLRARGVPIDGVGFQTHAPLQSPLNHLGDTLRMFADLGVDVAVTELDVRMRLSVDDAKLATQAEIYARATAACLAVTRCVSLTVWGFTDAYSWVPVTQPNWGAAHLFDKTYQPKPAYAAVHATLGNREFTGTAKAGHSLHCLQLPDGDSGAQLIQRGCGDTDAQQFDFRRVGPHAYTVRSRRGGTCLTVAGASTDDGAAVVQRDCAGGDHQRFDLRRVATPGSDQHVQLVAVHSGKCVEVTGGSRANGAPIQQRSCGARDNQTWRLTGAPGHL